MAHVPGARVGAHMAGVHQDLVSMVSGGRMMLWQAVVGGLLVVMVRSLVECGGCRVTGVPQRCAVVVCIIWVWWLVLFRRMRLLCGVIDIVVRSYSVIARQRVSDAWVPPERAALAGRRVLNGENLFFGGPAGQRRKRGGIIREGGERLRRCPQLQMLGAVLLLLGGDATACWTAENMCFQMTAIKTPARLVVVLVWREREWCPRDKACVREVKRKGKREREREREERDTERREREEKRRKTREIRKRRETRV